MRGHSFLHFIFPVISEKDELDILSLESAEGKLSSSLLFVTSVH